MLITLCGLPWQSVLDLRDWDEEGPEVDVNFDGLLVGIGVKFGVNGRNGAKKIGGVGEDGGGEKFVKFGERVLDSTPVVNSSQSAVRRWRKLAFGRKEK